MQDQSGKQTADPNRKKSDPAHGEPKRKPKPRPKHARGAKSNSKKPAARTPGEAPAPKAAKVGVKDPWADAAPARREQPEEEHEAESEEHESTDEQFGDAVGYFDDAHIGAEALLSGDTAGKGLSGLATALGEEQAELVAGELGGMETAFGAGSAAIASPLSIAGGIMELKGGIAEARRDAVKGSIPIMSGSASIVSGVAGLASLTGSAVAAGLAPAAAGFGAGVKIGAYGSEEAKEAGWLHDREGNAATPATWMADRGEDADRWVTKRTHNETLGTIAGGAATVGMAPVGGAVALGGAINGGVLKAEGFGESVGKVAAHHDRSEAYSGAAGSGGALGATDGVGYRNPYTGQVSIAQRGTDEARAAGEQMADYDDQLSDRVGRAKVLHPERWGEGPNAVSMTNKLAEEIHAATHGTNKRSER
ncbi:MAG: hypothetical protein ABJE66_29385 [Deltaproteobacteria bacterium]